MNVELRKDRLRGTMFLLEFDLKLIKIKRLRSLNFRIVTYT